MPGSAAPDVVDGLVLLSEAGAVHPPTKQARVVIVTATYWVVVFMAYSKP
jgi:hypothetical protein